MNPKWKKKLVNTGWLALTLAGMLVLGAAVSRKNKKVCTGINVEITGPEDHLFVDEKEVAKLLNANQELTGSPIETINLPVLESRLENDKWIRRAELFIDNNQVLQVVVEENEPVARIFTVGGYSYYIDSSCRKLPLSDRLSARVPMFTNFPSDRTRLGRVDSSLMASLKNMALYINSYPFWKAQVAQIDIDDNRELEVIPTVGNHRVLLGKAANWEEKFNRLYAFYKEVWAKVGLEKYEQINVQFNGQVVATRRGSLALVKVDSVKARQALDELMARLKANDDSGHVRNSGGDNLVKRPVITTQEQANGIAAVATDPKTTQPKSTDPKTTQPKPTDPKTTQPKPIDPKTTQPKPTAPKPNAPKPIAPKPAAANKPVVQKTKVATQQQVKIKSAVVKPTKPVLNKQVSNKVPKAVMKKKER